MEKAVVIFNIKDVALIENIPDFEYVGNYHQMEMVDVHRNEWGKIRLSNHEEIRFLGFSKLNLNSSAAFNGEVGSIEPQEMHEHKGSVRVSAPTMEYLFEVLQLIMSKLSQDSTKYPPQFRIWTERGLGGDFFVRYSVIIE